MVYKRIQHMMRNVDAQKGTIERGMNMGNTLFIGGVQLTVVIIAIMASNALTGAWASVMVAVAAIGTQAWFEALQPMIAAVHHGAESKVATSRLMALSNEPISIVDPISSKSFNPNDDIIFTDVSLVMMNIAIFMRILDYIFNKDNLLLSLVLVDLARRHCLICLSDYMIMVVPFV